MLLTDKERDLIDEGITFLEEDFPEASELLRKLLKDECPTFEPDWASPPGHSIKDICHEMGTENVRYLGLTPSMFRMLLDGRLTINEELAAKLEEHLRGPAHFWMERERLYRRAVARLEPTYIPHKDAVEVVALLSAALGGQTPQSNKNTLVGMVREVCEHLETVTAERDSAVGLAGRALDKWEKGNLDEQATVTVDALTSIAAICPSISGRMG